MSRKYIAVLILSLVSFRGVAIVCPWDEVGEDVSRLVNDTSRVVQRPADIQSAELLLDRSLSPTEKNALEAAHQHGRGHMVNGKYTLAQLAHKARLLQAGGFTADEASRLLRAGIAGDTVIDRDLWRDDRVTTAKRSEKADVIEQRRRDLETVMPYEGVPTFRTRADFYTHYNYDDYDAMLANYFNDETYRVGGQSYLSGGAQDGYDAVKKEGKAKWVAQRDRYRAQVDAYQELMKTFNESGRGVDGLAKALEGAKGKTLGFGDNAYSDAVRTFYADAVREIMGSPEMSSSDRLRRALKLMEIGHKLQSRFHFASLDAAKILDWAVARYHGEDDLYFEAVAALAENYRENYKSTGSESIPFIKSFNEGTNQRNLRYFDDAIASGTALLGWERSKVVAKLWTSRRVSGMAAKAIVDKDLRPHLVREGAFDPEILRLWVHPFITNPSSSVGVQLMDELKGKLLQDGKKLLDDPALDSLIAQHPTFGQWLDRVVSGK